MRTILVAADLSPNTIAALAGPISLESPLGSSEGGLRIIGDLSFEPGEPAAEREASLQRLRGGCDVVVLDGGSGVTEAALHAALSADQLVVPTSPDPASLADSYAFLKLLSRAGYSSGLGVVATLTESDSQAAEVALRIQDVARQFLGLNVANLGGIPRDAHVSRAAEQHGGHVTVFHDSSARRAIDDLAAQLDPRGPAAAASAGVLPRIAALFL